MLVPHNAHPSPEATFLPRRAPPCLPTHWFPGYWLKDQAFGEVPAATGGLEHSRQDHSGWGPSWTQPGQETPLCRQSKWSATKEEQGGNSAGMGKGYGLWNSDNHGLEAKTMNKWCAACSGCSSLSFLLTHCLPLRREGEKEKQECCLSL